MSKDTVAGGYGSRFTPFSRTTAWVHWFKRQYQDLASVQLAYIAAIFSQWGHQVDFSGDELVDADLAIVLSSLVDHRHEAEWADAMRARGVRVGFTGLAASKLPQLFADHADFILNGEPEEAVGRLARGERLSGICRSEPVMDLDALPFPRWDLITKRRPVGIKVGDIPAGGGVPLLASRGCPESCTYCPHRILACYRSRSVGNVVDEIEQLCQWSRRPYIIFRDPLFSENREHILALCDELHARDLRIHFECETRLDRLDGELLRIMHGAGLRTVSFGVESVSPQTLRKVGRRPIPEDHQRQVIGRCRDLGITTAAFFVLGFPSDDWGSIAATIEYATDLGPTFAQFKLLTPYPATPLWKQMEPVVFEKNWERFDGYTPTFNHPNLSSQELMFLLGAAYTHFYVRPSYIASILMIADRTVLEWVGRLDRRVSAHISRTESERMRHVTC